MKKAIGLHPFLLAILLSSVTWAQGPQTEPSPKPVTIGFLALGHDKRPYTDLKQSDLAVLDNRQPVRSIISLKKGSELPLRVGFLIDASNSQRHSALYQPEIEAASNFLNQILTSSDDRVFVAKVNDTPKASEFMSTAQFANFKLNVAPEGATALYDGISIVCDSRMKTDGASASRRVLILLSDGDDNMSFFPRDAAIAKALEAGVVIFAVSTEDDSSAPYFRSAKGNSTLKHFAQETGGEVFLHLNRKKIYESFAAIMESINNMYYVTFIPAETSEKDLHRIELKASGKKRIRFRAPKGYYRR